MENRKDTLRLEEASKYLKVNPSTIKNWVAQKKIKVCYQLVPVHTHRRVMTFKKELLDKIKIELEQISNG